MYYIHPDECIECGACEPECPVNAIFNESAVPDEWKSFIQKNRKLSGLSSPVSIPATTESLQARQDKQALLSAVQTDAALSPLLVVTALAAGMVSFASP